MEIIKKDNADGFFDAVESFLYGHISEYELICSIKDLIMEVAETVYERHHT